eukprot:491881-Pleurochrysis_carterae.AAC.2
MSKETDEVNVLKCLVGKYSWNHVVMLSDAQITGRLLPSLLLGAAQCRMSLDTGSTVSSVRLQQSVFSRVRYEVIEDCLVVICSIALQQSIVSCILVSLLMYMILLPKHHCWFWAGGATSTRAARCCLLNSCVSKRGGDKLVSSSVAARPRPARLLRLLVRVRVERAQLPPSRIRSAREAIRGARSKGTYSNVWYSRYLVRLLLQAGWHDVNTCRFQEKSTFGVDNVECQPHTTDFTQNIPHLLT